MLEADGIELNYASTTLLTDVYFKCGIGEVTGIFGRNGAGKSSLLKVIFGSIKPKSKSIRLDGKYIHRPFKQKGLIKYVPSDGYAFPYQKLSHLVEMNCISKSDSSYYNLMKSPEISDNLTVKFKDMSFGIRKFTQILVTLYSPSAYILLDDPFSNLSPILIESILLSIDEVKKTKA